MYVLANNSVYLVPMLYSMQYCFSSSSSQRSNMKSWEICFTGTLYISSTGDTYWTILYQTSFFHCRILARPFVYCKFLLDSLTFFSLQTCYSEIVEICTFCRQLPCFAYQPVAFSFAVVNSCLLHSRMMYRSYRS